MSETGNMVISKGWCRFCPACGQRDAPFIEQEHAVAAAIQHHNECEAKP